MNDSSKQHPIVTRPHMPGYGVKPENEGDGLFDWAWSATAWHNRAITGFVRRARTDGLTPRRSGAFGMKTHSISASVLNRAKDAIWR